MIFREQQQAIATTLAEWAFFTKAPGCPVYWMGQKEEETGKPMDTANALERALATSGAAALVLEPIVSCTENIYGSLAIKILFLENVSQNRGDDGTGICAYDYAEVGTALLLGKEYAPWSGLWFEGIDPVDVSDEGIEAWILSLRCQTLFDVIAQVLGDELGAMIVDETGAPILLTPTEA